MRTNKNLIKLLVSSLALLLPGSSQAKKLPCGRTFVPFRATEHITGHSWTCNQEQVSKLWRDFDFDRKDWDDGFGYYNACDNDLPLKRTFNALKLIENAGSSQHCDIRDWNPLNWSYCYIKAIDELDARCMYYRNNKPVPGLVALTRPPDFLNNEWTRLYDSFFYSNVVHRASFLVHEARHVTHHCPHVSCRGGVRNCDKTYFSGCGHKIMGAYALQVHWLAHYVWLADPKWTTGLHKRMAIDSANLFIDISFVKKPCFRLDSVTGRLIANANGPGCSNG